MSIFLIVVILFAAIFINFYPEKVNNNNIMNGKVSKIYSNGFLIKSETSKSCMAYLMDETVFSSSSDKLIEIGDTVVVEHTGQVLETNIIQIYCKKIWKKT
jgi:3D (Asp-Asp-Asp) domain-containing protein